ncbi:MAG: ABC transporter substrate-binding protein [Firmicutes bacterium]|nr:ABC transporter substrate-binding protein [Bacillota bacterium]
MSRLARISKLVLLISCFALLVVTLSCFAATKPRKLTIGAIVPTLNHEFWKRYVEFMKKGAQELGVNLIVLNAEDSGDKLVQYIEDLVSRGVDGLIYVPYFNTGRKGIMEAARANIPVICTDTYPENLTPGKEFKNYISFIGPSDESAGYQMALALFKHTPAAKDGKKYIGVVNGTPGTSVAINRRKGLEKALKEHPEVVVVGEVVGYFVRDKSQSATEDLYQGHPEIKGIWAANGGTATGVIAALKSFGKKPGKDVMVVGMDLNPENVEAVKDGELLFDIGGHWLQGGFALVIMYDYLHGYKVRPEETSVELSLLPVMKDTYDRYMKDYPNGMLKYDFKSHSRVYNPSASRAIVELKYSE